MLASLLNRKKPINKCVHLCVCMHVCVCVRGIDLLIRAIYIYIFINHLLYASLYLFGLLHKIIIIIIKKMDGENKLYTKTRKLENHDNAVWDIQATKEYIYSAGFDGKINEWDVNNGNLMCTFNIKEGEEGHDGQIWSCTVMKKINECIASGMI